MRPLSWQFVRCVKRENASGNWPFSDGPLAIRSGIITPFSASKQMAIRVQQNPEDFGRCGCGRRDYCDGSHGLSAAAWAELEAAEAKAEQEQDALDAAEAAAPAGDET